MNNLRSQEILVTTIFAVVLLLVINPFGFWMPAELVSLMLGGIVVLFGVYASFILREKPQDEREQLHRFIANRFAYLLGTATLVIGITYQGLTTGHIDSWLLTVLGVMVVGKTCSLLYSDKNH